MYVVWMGGSVPADVTYEIWEINVSVLPDYDALGAPDDAGVIDNFDIESRRGEAEYTQSCWMR